jgi:hypothetical protein
MEGLGLFSYLLIVLSYPILSQQRREEKRINLPAFLQVENE